MSTQTKDWVRQLANAFIIPATILYNFWPAREPYSTIGAISRDTEPLLAAAGWTFSIWGLIFLGQLVYAVYQLLPSQRANPVLRRIGLFTASASLGEGLWNALFTARLFGAAWAVMLLILASLIAVEIKLGNSSRRGRELWLIRVPFAVTLGWISVATILNSAQFFSTLGWSGEPLTPLFWSISMVIVAASLGVVMAVFRRNPAFAATVAWGLAGIAYEKYRDEPSLSMAAAIASGVLVSLVLIELLAMQRGVSPRGLPRHA